MHSLTWHPIGILLLALQLLTAGLRADTEVELILLGHKDSLYAERHLMEVLKSPANVVWRSAKVALKEGETTRLNVPSTETIPLAHYADVKAPVHTLHLTPKDA